MTNLTVLAQVASLERIKQEKKEIEMQVNDLKRNGVVQEELLMTMRNDLSEMKNQILYVESSYNRQSGTRS